MYRSSSRIPSTRLIRINWLGESVGHYEGNDTLVVDTVGFTGERGWIRRPSGQRSASRRRAFSRPNYGSLHYEATIEDPKNYTKPWTTGFDVKWRRDGSFRNMSAWRTTKICFNGDDGATLSCALNKRSQAVLLVQSVNVELNAERSAIDLRGTSPLAPRITRGRRRRLRAERARHGRLGNSARRSARQRSAPHLPGSMG